MVISALRRGTSVLEITRHHTDSTARGVRYRQLHGVSLAGRPFSGEFLGVERSTAAAARTGQATGGEQARTCVSEAYTSARRHNSKHGRYVPRTAGRGRGGAGTAPL